LVARFVLGFTLYFLGEFESARAHAEESLPLYDSEQHRSLAFVYSMDMGVELSGLASWVLWPLGYPDQALKASRKGLTLAEELAHSSSSILALNVETVVHQFRREAEATQSCAEALIALCAEHGNPFFLAWGGILQGWAVAQQGQRERGLALMRQGLTAWGGRVGESHWLGLLAEACAETGQFEEGMRLVADALTDVNRTGERFFEAELYRFRGELTLKQQSSGQSRATSVKQAESCFGRAIAIARQQQAKSWELRATTSLARLLSQQDRRDEARAMLAEIYGWFTEGFDTADLKDAKALLDELAT
jgi:predicted ATPase